MLCRRQARDGGMDMHLDRLTAVAHGASSGVAVIVVSLSALAVVCAATVIALPIICGSAERPSREMASAPIPDDVVSASLRGIQSSQRQHAAALESLAQSSAAQEADLKRIFDQLSLLTARMDALQNAAMPTFAMPPPNARAEGVAPSRRHRSRNSKTSIGASAGDATLSVWQLGTR